MNKYFFDVDKLKNNPCILEVTSTKLTLKTSFKIKLFEAWKITRDKTTIIDMLSQHGLTIDLVGKNFYRNQEALFIASGFPYTSSEEIQLIKNYEERNPLLLSKLFTRKSNKHGIHFTQELIKSLKSLSSNMSLKNKLEILGIDPIDMGTNRLERLAKELSKNKDCSCYSEYQDVIPNNNIQETSVATTMSNYCSNKAQEEIYLNIAIQNNSAEEPLPDHSYINKINNGKMILKNSFFNESYCLLPCGIKEIIRIYELDKYIINEHHERGIEVALIHWKKTDDENTSSDEQSLRIQLARNKAMNQLVKENFAAMKEALPRMDILAKRKLCKWVSELPRDVTGYYTIQKVTELLGIKKSTYYAILNNENYGIHWSIKDHQDEEDIKIIRQVVEYKGFKKGIRQVFMLMPKITGKQFTFYRIRRLMNKYGLRTTIRRPNKNRKAMIELIKRNKKVNLLMRKFKLHRPNEVRLTDVTYLNYGDDLRAYGSACIDPVTGRLICFIVRENNDLQLALDTLENMDNHPAKIGAILHSDQGILYMTDEFQTAVSEKMLTQSMSRRGNCWDNAVQESFFGHFKDECNYEDCQNIEQLQKYIEEYANYYNNERGMWEKGKMTPIQYEEYLNNMDDETFAQYLEKEEKAYLAMKEKSAQKAIEKARNEKDFIASELERISHE